MSDARIERNMPGPGTGVDGLALTSPFDGAFVSALKGMIPAADRAWDPARRTWWVSAEHEARLVKLCVAAFGSVLIYGGDSEPDRLVDHAGEYLQERLL